MEHIESQSHDGVAVIKVLFQPDAKVELALSQIAAIMQTILRALPPGIVPPNILKYDVSRVSILQLGLSSQTLSEQDLYDLGQKLHSHQAGHGAGRGDPAPLRRQEPARSPSSGRLRRADHHRPYQRKSRSAAVLKNGQASTLSFISKIKEALPDIQAGLPQDLKVTQLFDQSLFVRASMKGVLREGAIAAGLTGLMILLFLGSGRSTLIVCISIPLWDPNV